MNASIAAAVRKRQVLVVRAAVQRTELAAFASRWHESIAVADGAFRLGKRLRRHPALLAVGIALLLGVRRRRRAFLWSGPLIVLWELYRSLSR